MTAGYPGVVNACEPWCLVVAGPSASGKSSVAEQVALRTGAVVADGDDFHSPEAVAKMRSGEPLTDADRRPWLAAIGDWIDQQHRAGSPAVISCSALRRTYRDQLVRGRPQVRFCLLDVPEAELRRRLAARTGHFMPASLLASQLALLEPLTAEEPGLTLTGGSPAEIADDALRVLGLVRSQG